MAYDAELGLVIADYCCLFIYTVILGFTLFIVGKYVIPLRIKSAYIVLFYVTLVIVMASSIATPIYRLAYN